MSPCPISLDSVAFRIELAPELVLRAETSLEMAGTKLKGLEALQKSVRVLSVAFIRQTLDTASGSSYSHL